MRLISILLILIVTHTIANADSESLVFEMVIFPSAIKIPQAGSSQAGFFYNTSVLLALKVTNVTDKTILVDKYATPLPKLMDSDGHVVNSWVARDGTVYPDLSDFAYLNPHRSLYILVDCALFKYIQGTLELSGSTQDGGEWALRNLPAKLAKYQISLIYKPQKDDYPQSLSNSPHFHQDQPWYGEVETKPISIEIVN